MERASLFPASFIFCRVMANRLLEKNYYNHKEIYHIPADFQGKVAGKTGFTKKRLPFTAATELNHYSLFNHT
jgi:hypothetical protein